MTGSAQTTVLIRRLADGDRGAADELFGAVYEEIHRMAVRQLGLERSGHTLQPTALVNEAYLRLVDGATLSCGDRTHFMAVAAQVIRRLLIDHARKRLAVKRGGGGRAVKVDLDGGPLGDEGLAGLDEAMERLAEHHPRQARVVELKFFGDLTYEEIGGLLGIAGTTARADWCFARAWLRRELAS